ncbi:MAG: hypothetical protein K2X27_04215 [Candidatus Obscuribacterales bacterium]|nr:hypothetical protein [Candidatus Obscuribacterales bacterium]
MKKNMARTLSQHALRYDDDNVRSKGKLQALSRVRPQDLVYIENEESHENHLDSKVEQRLDRLPKRERMRIKGRRSRCLDTRILKNFLNSRLGQPWDEVYSEICQVNRLDNFNQWELRREIDRLVETKVILVDGKPKDPSGLCLFSDFWVEPKSGLLMGVEDTPRPKWKRQFIFPQVFVDAWTRYVKVDDIWYEVRLAPIPVAPQKAARDIVFREWVLINPNAQA